jgi:hypothetical protein
MAAQFMKPPRPRYTGPSRARVPSAPLLLLLTVFLLTSGGCATIRVTDPVHTATEQFLLTESARKAVAELSLEGLRDQLVWMETLYLTGLSQPSLEHTFLLGELRARLLREGIRLAPKRDGATVIMEVRSGGVGVDRLEYLLGIPSFITPAGSGTLTVGGVPIVTPELAILKNTKQRGFASVSIIAYRANTGELLAASGPFVGKTRRDDYWILGTGPRTVGDIPPAEKEKR